MSHEEEARVGAGIGGDCGRLEADKVIQGVLSTGAQDIGGDFGEGSFGMVDIGRDEHVVFPTEGIEAFGLVDARRRGPAEADGLAKDWEASEQRPCGRLVAYLLRPLSSLRTFVRISLPIPFASRCNTGRRTCSPSGICN